ncbi:MAG: Arm DNA-binding domain-containing protein [Rheinheimera sp.]|nr:Arm DNA-binding domain-containing protein [Rheinheimera sp.]
MPLSDSWLKSTPRKECDKPYEKTDRDGLSVRVSAKGKIVFQMRFRVAGKMQRCDIGTYPLISLKTAREECLRYRAALEKGDDPRIVKAVERMERQNAGTVAELFEQWYQADMEDRSAQAPRLWSSISKHLLPTLGRLPAQQVTLHHWLGVIEPLAKKTPAMSARLLRLTKQMMRWAVKAQPAGIKPAERLHQCRPQH